MTMLTRTSHLSPLDVYWRILASPDDGYDARRRHRQTQPAKPSVLRSWYSRARRVAMHLRLVEHDERYGHRYTDQAS